MHQTELLLSDQDRPDSDDYRVRSLHRGRKFNRTHILAALDRKIQKPAICIDEAHSQALRETHRPGLSSASSGPAPLGNPRNLQRTSGRSLAQCPRISPDFSARSHSRSVRQSSIPRTTYKIPSIGSGPHSFDAEPPGQTPKLWRQTHHCSYFTVVLSIGGQR